MPPQLKKAVLYSLQGTAKRLRPLLMLSAVEDLHGNIETAFAPACSLEYLHIYSCIHDDLPAMDNDDERRGFPTLHKAFPEWVAILTGDFFLTYAFDLLANTEALSSQKKISLINILAHRAGGHGMIEGQILDMTNKNVDWTDLQKMHIYKTGYLIIATLEFACVISNADDKTCQILKTFGQNLGLGYQIVDDILDQKEEESKATTVSLLGLSEAKKIAQDLKQQAFNNLRQLDFPTPLLHNMTEKLLQRDF